MMPEMLFVLVLVKQISEHEILTYAAEFESRTECERIGAEVLKVRPDISFTKCAAYKLREDADVDRGSEQQAGAAD